MCYFAPDFSNELENFKIAKSLLTFKVLQLCQKLKAK